MSSNKQTCLKLCNNVRLNSENITPEEVTDWLESNQMDGGFEILIDGEIVSSMTIIEEEQIDDDQLLTKNLELATQKQKQSK